MAKTTTPKDNPRLTLFNNDLGKKPALRIAFEKLYNEKKGDWPAIHSALQKNKSFGAAVVKNLAFTHELSDWTNENNTLVSLFQNNKETNSMRDIALTFNKKKLEKQIAGSTIPKGETKSGYADKLYNELYAKEPTAIVINMINDPKVPLLNDAIGVNVASVLEKQPGFNIKTTSIYEVLKKEDAFKEIPAKSHEAVIMQLKTLQRIAAVSPVSDAIPVLYKAKLHTAFQISEMPQSQFMAIMNGKGLDNTILLRIHSNAQQARVRNEHTLMALREVHHGTGVAMIDRSLNSGDEANTVIQNAADDHHLSWDLLFGDADFCECSECNSVYGASAYFVELLQYLRNNNLDPNAKDTLIIKSDPEVISGTPLEKLIKRRPDLGCLELTCKNTNTILPYIDLVNEVMEQYTAHKTTIAFNVADETSGELLSTPQHTEKHYAYQKLKDAVYPFTLPYHQPVDIARIYLKQLDTSRYEVNWTFRNDNSGKFARLRNEDSDRAADAEFLGLTTEEYVILTKESFESKALMEKLHHKTLTDNRYQELIGVKPVYEYYGYENAVKMLGDSGLTLIKKEFLPRTGIDYFNLVDLLKTGYINPSVPKGKSKVIMERLRFSYRFLQNYAIVNGISKLSEYIVSLERFADLFPKTLNCPNPGEEQPGITDIDIAYWVKCNFEKVGKMIVIESGRGCVNGKILLNQQSGISIENPNRRLIVENCKILYGEGKKEVATIDKKTGKVTLTDPQNSTDSTGLKNLVFIGNNDEKGIFLAIGNAIYLSFLDQKDSCDLDTATLQHLDGTSLTIPEYDRIHRFIRLWRKLEWTIDETDKAISGLSIKKMPGNRPKRRAEAKDCQDYEDQEEASHLSDINSVLIHQLTAVKRLLDKTNLELFKLLSFWTNISTTGEKPLYQKLFLSPTVLDAGKVFRPDQNGNYLNGNLKISQHVPVLMASLNLSADDLEAIRKDNALTDILTIGNLSVFYRYRLLAKILRLSIPEFISIKPLFGDVFMDAHATLQFIEQCVKMEDAGFTHKQLNYIIRDLDDEKKPFAPSQKAILKLTRILYDGLNTIENAHQDLKADAGISGALLQKLNIQEQATSELVKAKANLLFDSALVEKITKWLEGTHIFTTHAPKNLTFTTAGEKTLKEKLQKKLKYDGIHGSIHITGILTATESNDFKTIINNTQWKEALTRIEKQQSKVFKELLYDVVETEKKISPERKTVVEDAEKELKKGDIFPPDQNTAPKKRVAFLEIFLPYLRQELSHRFIVDALSDFESLETKITDVLISQILKLGTPVTTAYSIFESIRESNLPVGKDWSGYFIPARETTYTFIIKNFTATNSKPHPVISIDGVTLVFAVQEYPADEWWSADIPLQADKLYKLSNGGTGLALDTIFWKTSTSDISPVSSSDFIPDYAYNQCEQALHALKKVSMLVSAFDLSAEEIKFLDFHRANFDNLNFNAISLIHWLRLEAFTRMRSSLPQSKLNILDFWKWANDNSSITAELSEKIASLTHWKREHVDKLIANDHFNIGKPEDYRNEKNLLKLQEALTVAAKTGMDINTLFDWAKPTSDFDQCRIIADSIQKTVHAQYNQSDREQMVKPLNDQLRNNQKNALIVYLLQQKELKAANVTDADGLFEYFLIDTQMDTCMETSRIKQGISSVQLFIQRCFLGLEKEIKPGLLDRKRWEWMERYRVWVANRKVFLYPENWIESNLRDDKSHFFKELESELLQKDINRQSATDALKTFLYKVDEVANMEVVGLYIEGNKTMDTWDKGARLHVFSRTRNAPYFFYYRYFALDEMNWYAWEKMQVDIPVYDEEDPITHLITGNGCYVTPVVWNNRLLIFFPLFMKKTRPNEASKEQSIKQTADEKPRNLKPLEYWEIKMAYSEYRNEKWTQKQLSKEPIYYSTPTGLIQTLTNSLDEAILKADKLYRYFISPMYPLGFDQSVLEDLSSLAGTPMNTTLLANRPYIQTLLDKASARVTIASNELAVVYAGKISLFEFVPVPSVNNSLLAIKVFYNNNAAETGIFEFDGNSLQTPPFGTYPDKNSVAGNNSVHPNYFHNNIEVFYQSFESLQTSTSLQTRRTQEYIFRSSLGKAKVNGIQFYHHFSRDLIGKINLGQLDPLFSYEITDNANAFGAFDDDENLNTPYIYHELKRPYSLYNWELFFHVPIMIANALSKAHHYEEATKWFHYVFNPIADGNDDKRFWLFTPFHTASSKRILDRIFNNLKPNTADITINEWRNNPFMPHGVARNRPVAYMKYVVMKYIDNILDWGDYLFRQDTIESINQATQLYILAGHILGPRPMMIPKRGKNKPQTYLGLLSKWDAFGNAIVALELASPFSNQTNLPANVVNGEITFANIFGSASSSYFGLPNNPKLMQYWDTIADRLFKIRHCRNIEGVFRKLPLFEPPIDPALLVKAAAQGLSISSVVNDMNSAMPNYRFYYLLQKALELCNELKSLGGAMLSALEKKDNEGIVLIRARHEGTMTNLMMEIKKLQLEEAQKSLESLHQNRKTPEARMKYYLQLIGEDAGKVPGSDTDFSELGNSIEKPVDDSGLRLSQLEKEDIDKANLSAALQLASGIPEFLAGIFYSLPTLAVDLKPFGIGIGASYGGSNLGQLTQTVSKGLQITASHFSHQSSMAAKKGGFQRALQERIMQANAAGFEIKQIDKQITAHQIRINITNQEILNQQEQINNAGEIEEFLKNKYTNEELYIWMRGSLKTLYRQVYNIAYDLAKKAEKTYCFERGISNASFIQSGYFDAGREGLLAGEQLYVGLKQLESAYQEKRGYDYEITKHISLRMLDPLALLQLKATGKCEFELPEVLFDLDYPGHFKRRIKSVSISIPCIAGPYTGVNATLRMLNNRFRNSAIANNYTEKTNEPDDRFILYNIPITAIAASSAQNDAGLFELNFKDERYLPFEGAGVISKWRLELPTEKQFDYNTISDLILHVKYISSEGGEQLNNSASKSVNDFIRALTDLGEREGLFALVDLKHDMPNEWNLLVKKGTASITIDKSRLSYLAQSKVDPAISLMFISKKQINRIKCRILNTDITIKLDQLSELGLYKSKSLDITLNTAFVIYGYRTIPVTPMGTTEEIDNGELKLLEDLLLVIKYKLT